MHIWLGLMEFGKTLILLNLCLSGLREIQRETFCCTISNVESAKVNKHGMLSCHGQDILLKSVLLYNGVK